LTIADDYRSLSDDQKVKFLFGLENAFNEETVGLLMTVLDDQGEYDLARVEATKALGLGAAASPTSGTNTHGLEGRPTVSRLGHP
jgi:hypothetical protein